MNEINSKTKSEEIEEDKNVKVIMLKFFKYWPTKEIRSAWR